MHVHIRSKSIGSKTWTNFRGSLDHAIVIGICSRSEFQTSERLIVALRILCNSACHLSSRVVVFALYGQCIEVDPTEMDPSLSHLPLKLPIIILNVGVLVQIREEMLRIGCVV